MSYVNLDQLPQIISEYAYSRLIPNVSPLKKFAIGAKVGLITADPQGFIKEFTDMVKNQGVLNEHNQLDINKVRVVLDGGFKACDGKITYADVTLDKEEGDILLNMLESHKTEGE